MRLKLAIGMTVIAAGTMAPGAFAQVARTAPRARSAATVSSNAPYLGIGVQDVDGDRAKALKLNEVRGAEITSVADDSPAAKAGIKDGDVVLEYNGQRVEGGEQLSRFVRETPVGRQVKIGVWRNGGMQMLTATVEAHKGFSVFSSDGNSWVMPMPATPMAPMPPMPPGFDMPQLWMQTQSGMLGISGESLNQQEQLADFFGAKDGVLVRSVGRNSAAEKAGIKAGDVITKIDDTPVSSTRDITSTLRANRSKKTFNITVIRAKKEMTLQVTVEAAAMPGTAVRAGLVIPGVEIVLPTIRISTTPIQIVRRDGVI